MCIRDRFQSDGVFIEHIPGSEMYVTGYIYHDESGTLYILRCDTDESFRPEGYHNPIAPEFMTDISDAYESAYTIMLNLNKTWIQKQGDFFVDSPIILLAAIIWYLKIYEGGKDVYKRQERTTGQILRPVRLNSRTIMSL